MAFTRPATLLDAPACHEIYAFYVAHSTATWEWDVPSLSDFTEAMRLKLESGLPYIILSQTETHGTEKTLGYAYASPFRPRKGWQWTWEDSIFLHPGVTGKGLGSFLLQALIDACTAQGAREMIAVISVDAGCKELKDSTTGQQSMALHSKLGFQHAGRMLAAGEKFGKLFDSIFMQKRLQEKKEAGAAGGAGHGAEAGAGAAPLEL